MAILGLILAIPNGPSSLATEPGIRPVRLPLAVQSPLITITGLSPNPANPGRTIRLNFTVQDPNSNVTATWVDWGDGSSPDLIFNMTSASMCQADTCAIAPGDLLFAKPEDPSSIVNSSIIIFRPDLSIPNFLVAHRVVRIFPPNDTSTQYVFWTKSDTNSSIDYWSTGPGTPASQVVAVYQYTILPLASPTQRTDTHAYHVLGGVPSKTFTLTVNATDENGLQAQVTATETIYDASPSVGITGVSPNPVVAGSKVSLGFIATDPDGTISTVTINWGDGTSHQDLPVNSGLETHVYNSAGSYTIVIEAKDDVGLTSIPAYSTIAVKAQSSGEASTITLGIEPQLFYGIVAGVVVSIGIGVVIVVRAARRPARI